MQQRDTLTVKAAALVKVAPMEWRDFLLALGDYIEVHKENLIRSPLPELPVNQGKVQSLAILFDTLKQSPANSDKITRKKP